MTTPATARGTTINNNAAIMDCPMGGKLSTQVCVLLTSSISKLRKYHAVSRYPTRRSTPPYIQRFSRFKREGWFNMKAIRWSRTLSTTITGKDMYVLAAENDSAGDSPLRCLNLTTEKKSDLIKGPSMNLIYLSASFTASSSIRLPSFAAPLTSHGILEISTTTPTCGPPKKVPIAAAP